MTGSRFTKLLDLKGDTTHVVVKGVGLRLVLLHSNIWPARTKPGMVKVFRYSSVD
jgi:hypothetical protein